MDNKINAKTEEINAKTISIQFSYFKENTYLTSL